MNTPVNFELAKLLKEKRYDKPCLKCYLEDGLVQISSGDEGDLEEYNHNQWDNYSAPTIADVVMWLYEKHGIWVSVEPFMRQQGNCVYIYKIFKDSFIDTISRGSMGYNSPTEAYEAAISHTLTKLI